VLVDSGSAGPFKVVDRDWLVTYGIGSAHYVLVEAPAEDAGLVPAVIVDAVRAMGCQVLR
jgi:hypothetical protein